MTSSFEKLSKELKEIIETVEGPNALSEGMSPSVKGSSVSGFRMGSGYLPSTKSRPELEPSHSRRTGNDPEPGEQLNQAEVNAATAGFLDTNELKRPFDEKGHTPGRVPCALLYDAVDEKLINKRLFPDHDVTGMFKCQQLNMVTYTARLYRSSLSDVLTAFGVGSTDAQLALLTGKIPTSDLQRHCLDMVESRFEDGRVMSRVHRIISEGVRATVDPAARRSTFREISRVSPELRATHVVTSVFYGVTFVVDTRMKDPGPPTIEALNAARMVQVHNHIELGLKALITDSNVPVMSDFPEIKITFRTSATTNVELPFVTDDPNDAVAFMRDCLSDMKKFENDPPLAIGLLPLSLFDALTGAAFVTTFTPLSDEICKDLIKLHAEFKRANAFLDDENKIKSNALDLFGSRKNVGRGGGNVTESLLRRAVKNDRHVLASLS